jgi:hypothetical protein
MEKVRSFQFSISFFVFSAKTFPMRLSVKQLSNLLFAVAFVCAIPMLLGKTYGYRTAIHTVFIVCGAVALILSLVASRMESYKDDFNVIFWVGSLAMFVGFIMKTYYLPNYHLVLIGGLAISGISFFFNPFEAKKDKDDELLDQ